MHYRFVMLLMLWVCGCGTPESPAATSTPARPPVVTPSPSSVKAAPSTTPKTAVSEQKRSSERKPLAKKLDPSVAEGDGGPQQGKKSSLYKKRRIQGSTKADSQIVEAVLQNKHAVSETMQSRAFVLGIQRLVDSARYDRLEDLADLYRDDGQRLANGQRKSTVFYYALKAPRNMKNSFHYKVLQEWMTARPNSPLPKIAMARHLLDFEEGMFTSDMKQLGEPYKSYYENPVPTARRLLEEATQLRPDSDSYALLIDVVRREGGTVQAAEEYLGLADKLDPLNYHQEAQFARLLFYRGQDWRKALSKDENAFFIVTSYLKKPQTPPRELLTFYQATEKKFPRSALIKNYIAQLALRIRDEELAAKKFAELGDRPENYAWSPDEFYAKRNALESKGHKVRTGKSLALPQMPSEISMQGVSDELLRLEAQELLTCERYLELEAIASTYRSKKATSENGFAKVNLLYEGFTSEFFDDHPKGWELSLYAERWKRLQPNSVTAQTLAITSCVKEGWDIRGSGWADSVSPKAWEGFRERLDTGWAYFEELEAMGQGLDAEAYRNALTIGMGLQFDKARQNEILARAKKRNPDEPGPYQAMANYLLPRWSGSEEELAKFLSTVPVVPFPLLLTVVSEDIDIKDPRLLKKSLDGALTLARRRPTVVTWTKVLYLAAAAGDRNAGREAVSQLRGDWDGETLQTPTYYKKLVAWTQGAELR